MAGVGEVEHRAHPGRRRGRRGDQDGPGDAARACCPGRCTWTRRRRMWTGRPVRWAAGRGHAVAGGWSAAAGGGVLVRDQRHQRPRHPGGGRTGRTADGGERGTAGCGRAGRSSVPWLLSAKTEAALRAQAQRLAGFVAEQPDADCGPVIVAGRWRAPGRCLSIGRWWWPGTGRRWSTVWPRWRGTGPAAAVVSGVAGAGDRGGPVFVFSGSGRRSGSGWVRGCGGVAGVRARRWTRCAQALDAVRGLAAARRCCRGRRQLLDRGGCAAAGVCSR